MNILDFFFPKKCIGCQRIGEYVCFTCFAHISSDVSLRCLICTKPSFDGMTHPKCRGKYTIDGYFTALHYRGVVKKLLYQFKYAPYLTDLQNVLIDLLYDNLIQDELFTNYAAFQPIFVPIPLSPKKLRKRGYNQSEILAKNLAKRFTLSFENLLVRSKETKPQYGLKREERLWNMKEAFALNHALKITQYGKNKNIFLVDDVLTTGSTILEAAKVLKKNGYEKVWGVILAQD